MRQHHHRQTVRDRLVDAEVLKLELRKVTTRPTRRNNSVEMRGAEQLVTARVTR